MQVVRFSKIVFRTVCGVTRRQIVLFQYESSVAVRDRVAFACMFLSDTQVTQYEFERLLQNVYVLIIRYCSSKNNIICCTIKGA